MSGFARLLPSALIAAIAVSVSGCRDSAATGPQFEARKTAKVHGKVTFDGKPVTSGIVAFSPISSGGNATHAGKAASGEIREDGTYTLSTYAAGDGAILGQHKVAVGDTDPMKPLPGVSPPDLKTEVKEGDNELNIELTKKK